MDVGEAHLIIFVGVSDLGIFDCPIFICSRVVGNIKRRTLWKSQAFEPTG